MDVAALQPGQRVLVHAAAGGGEAPRGAPRRAAQLRSAVDPALTATAERAGVRVVVLVVEPDRLGLLGLLEVVDAGRLRVHVDRTFPLHRVADAHALGAAGGTMGKLVLTVP